MKNSIFCAVSTEKLLYHEFFPRGFPKLFEVILRGTSVKLDLKKQGNNFVSILQHLLSNFYKSFTQINGKIIAN